MFFVDLWLETVGLSANERVYFDSFSEPGVFAIRAVDSGEYVTLRNDWSVILKASSVSELEALLMRDLVGLY